MWWEKTMTLFTCWVEQYSSITSGGIKKMKSRELRLICESNKKKKKKKGGFFFGTKTSTAEIFTSAAEKQKKVNILK